MAAKKMPPKGATSKKNKPKKAVPKKATPKKAAKPTVKQAMKQPAKFAGSAKVKLKPYGKPNVRKRSGVDKFMETALQFSPLWGVNEAFKLVSGVDTNKPMYKNGKYVPKSKRKANRLMAAGNVALGAVPVTKVTKAIKTVKQGNQLRTDLKYGKNTYKQGKNTRRKSNITAINEFG